MAERLTLFSIVWSEGNLYVAWCPDLDIASQGKNIESALDNLKEAIELYLEDEDAVLPEDACMQNNDNQLLGSCGQVLG